MVLCTQIPKMKWKIILANFSFLQGCNIVWNVESFCSKLLLWFGYDLCEILEGTSVDI